MPDIERYGINTLKHNMILSEGDWQVGLLTVRCCLRCGCSKFGCSWKNVKNNEKKVVKTSDVRYPIDKEVQSDVEEKD